MANSSLLGVGVGVGIGVRVRVRVGVRVGNRVGNRAGVSGLALAPAPRGRGNN